MMIQEFIGKNLLFVPKQIDTIVLIFYTNCNQKTSVPKQTEAFAGFISRADRSGWRCQKRYLPGIVPAPGAR